MEAHTLYSLSTAFKFAEILTFAPAPRLPQRIAQRPLSGNRSHTLNDQLGSLADAHHRNASVGFVPWSAGRCQFAVGQYGPRAPWNCGQSVALRRNGAALQLVIVARMKYCRRSDRNKGYAFRENLKSDKPLLPPSDLGSDCRLPLLPQAK